MPVNNAGSSGSPYRVENETWPLLHSIYINQFQVDYRCKCERQNNKAFRRYLNKIQKSLLIKEKINSGTNLRTENVYSKDTVKSEKTSQSRRKLLEHNWQKAHILNIQRILINQLEKDSPIQKWVKYLNRNFTKEDIQLANKYMKRCSTLL